MKIKRIFEISLLLIITALCFFGWNEIQQPMRFETEKNKRFEATIAKLKLLRSLELCFRSEKGQFSDNFDSLLKFFKTKKSVLLCDSVLKNNISLDSLIFIPFQKDKKFSISATFLEISGKIKVPVFEISVSNEMLLNGLEKKYILQLNEKCTEKGQFLGLKIGSLIEVSDKGNWE